MRSVSRLFVVFALVAMFQGCGTSTPSATVANVNFTVNQLTEVVCYQTGGSLSWKLTFTEEPEVLHVEAAMRFLKACSKSVVFTNETPTHIVFEGNSVTITMPVSGMSKSYATVNSVKLLDRHGGTESVYAVAVVTSPQYSIEKMGESVKMELARFDGALRGHKVGEDDGITVTASFIATGTSSGSVALTYTGGVYRYAKGG